MITRKGNITDIIVFPVLVVMLVLSMFIYVFVYSQIADPLQAAANQALGMNDTQVAAAIDNVDSSLRILLTSIPFISLLFGLLSIVLAAQVPSNKGYLPFAIIVWIIGTIAAFISSDVLWTVMNLDVFIEITNSQPLLVSFVKYLGFITNILGAIILVVTYAKSTEGGSGTGGF